MGYANEAISSILKYFIQIEGSRLGTRRFSSKINSFIKLIFDQLCMSTNLKLILRAKINHST